MSGLFSERYCLLSFELDSTCGSNEPFLIISFHILDQRLVNYGLQARPAYSLLFPVKVVLEGSTQHSGSCVLWVLLPRCKLQWLGQRFRGPQSPLCDWPIPTLADFRDL